MQYEDKILIVEKKTIFFLRTRFMFDSIFFIENFSLKRMLQKCNHRRALNVKHEWNPIWLYSLKVKELEISLFSLRA